MGELGALERLVVKVDGQAAAWKYCTCEHKARGWRASWLLDPILAAQFKLPLQPVFWPVDVTAEGDRLTGIDSTRHEGSYGHIFICKGLSRSRRKLDMADECKSMAGIVAGT